MRFLLFLLLIGCANDFSDGANVDLVRESTIATAGAGNFSSTGDTVLAAIAGDTVRVLVTDTGRVLLWISLEAGKPVDRFRSGDLYEGFPTVRLLNVDGDGVLDLFVAWQYEEQASGILLRA